MVSADYPAFTRRLYDAHPGLERQTWEEQHRVRSEALFGGATPYVNAFRELGHDALDVYMNSAAMQRAWARRKRLRVQAGRVHVRWRRGVVPWIGRGPSNTWMSDVVVAQAAWFRPDVIFVLWVAGVHHDLLRRLRRHCHVLVGQHAATPLPDWDLSQYDLVVTSFPPTLASLRARSIRARYLRLAFDPGVLEVVPPVERTVPASFVGSVSSIHSSRIPLLEALARRVDGFEIYGPDLDGFAARSAAVACHRGEAWGLEMFSVFARSRIVVNHHGDVPAFANNLRLYEATGMGALLVTDAKPDLGQLFEPGTEVVAYGDPTEAAELVAHYLEHEEERAAIAAAGQQRTLRDHTWTDRVEELCRLIGDVDTG